MKSSGAKLKSTVSVWPGFSSCALDPFGFGSTRRQQAPGCDEILSALWPWLQTSCNGKPSLRFCLIFLQGTGVDLTHFSSAPFSPSHANLPLEKPVLAEMHLLHLARENANMPLQQAMLGVHTKQTSILTTWANGPNMTPWMIKVCLHDLLTSCLSTVGHSDLHARSCLTAFSCLLSAREPQRRSHRDGLFSQHQPTNSSKALTMHAK